MKLNPDFPFEEKALRVFFNKYNNAITDICVLKNNTIAGFPYYIVLQYNFKGRQLYFGLLSETNGNPKERFLSLLNNTISYTNFPANTHSSIYNSLKEQLTNRGIFNYRKRDYEITHNEELEIITITREHTFKKDLLIDVFLKLKR